MQLAFTLIELLVVATIIIVLATMGLVSYRTAVKNSHQAKCESDLQAIRQALVMYRSENSAYPTGYNFSGLVTYLKTEDYLGKSDDFNAPGAAVYNIIDLTSTTFKLTATGGNCSVTVTNP